MQTDNPLLGTWRSDKELTLRYGADVPAGSERFMQLLADKLGKLERSFTRDTSISSFKGDSSKRKYSITSLQQAQCVICIYGAPGEPDEQTTLHFVSSDLYWVPAANSREYFRKVLGTGEQSGLE